MLVLPNASKHVVDEWMYYDTVQHASWLDASGAEWPSTAMRVVNDLCGRRAPLPASAHDVGSRACTGSSRCAGADRDGSAADAMQGDPFSAWTRVPCPNSAPGTVAAEAPVRGAEARLALCTHWNLQMACQR